MLITESSSYSQIAAHTQSAVNMMKQKDLIFGSAEHDFCGLSGESRFLCMMDFNSLSSTMLHP